MIHFLLKVEYVIIVALILEIIIGKFRVEIYYRIRIRQILELLISLISTTGCSLSVGRDRSLPPSVSIYIVNSFNIIFKNKNIYQSFKLNKKLVPKNNSLNQFFHPILLILIKKIHIICLKRYYVPLIQNK